MSTADTRPARGTRPTNRRELIVAAASELFYRSGYANVSMSEIADAVAVGPSALYRHFRSKQQLLDAVVTDVIASSLEQLDASEASLAGHLAANAIARRRSGVLWRREARHLEPDSRELLQKQVRAYYRRVSSSVAAIRTDLGPNESELLADCAIGVSASISFHNLTLPEPDFQTLLEGLVNRAIEAEIPRLETASPPTSPAPDRIGSRREHLLAAAIELFARNGYAHVTMEDLGAAIGIAGPSIYNHFDKKEDVLVAAISRGAEWLRIDMNRALTEASDGEDAIRRLISSYRQFAFTNPGLVRILLTELRHVPEHRHERSHSVQLDYVADWVRTVQAMRPDWTPLSTRIRVQAVLGMFNEVAQSTLPQRFRNLGMASDAIAVNLL
jgi:AcrR family transcriptional regulator